jgi:hypothetical protein
VTYNKQDNSAEITEGALEAECHLEAPDAQ